MKPDISENIIKRGTITYINCPYNMKKFVFYDLLYRCYHRNRFLGCYCQADNVISLLPENKVNKDVFYKTKNFPKNYMQFLVGEKNCGCIQYIAQLYKNIKSVDMIIITEALTLKAAKEGALGSFCLLLKKYAQDNDCAIVFIGDYEVLYDFQFVDSIISLEFDASNTDYDEFEIPITGTVKDKDAKIELFKNHFLTIRDINL